MGLVFRLCGRAAQRADVTMLRVFEIKLPLEHTQDGLRRVLADALHVPACDGIKNKGVVEN